MITYVDLDDIVGKTFIDVSVDSADDALIFRHDDGSAFVFSHSQECCENVYIKQVDGDLADLVGTPIVNATETVSDCVDDDISFDEQRWTFYNFRTIKGSVTVQWYGTSNGYYSMGVDIKFVKE